MQKQVVNNLIKAGLFIWGVNEVCKRLPPGAIDSIIGALDRSLSTSGSAPSTPLPNPVTPLQLPASNNNLLTPVSELGNKSSAPSQGIQIATEPQAPLSLFQLPIDHDLTEIIAHPSVVLLLGKRGSGKSALAYRILELLRYKATPYVVGLPKEGQKLLPGWIGFARDLEEVPHDSIVLIDEAYLSYHSRGSSNARSKAMSQIINLSRQRNQTLVFVTQEARQIDKNIASSANVIIFKELNVLQMEFDRAELNKLARQAKTQFDGISGDKRRWSYIYSPDANFLGLKQSELPSFWKPSLSRIFAAGSPDPSTRYPRKMTNEERIERAKELFGSGLSYERIGKILNVTKGTAYNYVRDYPYKK